MCIVNLINEWFVFVSLLSHYAFFHFMKYNHLIVSSHRPQILVKNSCTSWVSWISDHMPILCNTAVRVQPVCETYIPGQHRDACYVNLHQGTGGRMCFNSQHEFLKSFLSIMLDLEQNRLKNCAVLGFCEKFADLWLTHVDFCAMIMPF